MSSLYIIRAAQHTQQIFRPSWLSPGSAILCRNYGKSSNARNQAQQERKDTIFEYSGKNSQRSERVFAWGYAATGALGVQSFLKPDKNQMPRKHQLSPHRLAFMDANNIKVHRVACGYGFTIFLTHSDKTGNVAYGTGINTDSQLGYHEYPPNSGRILDYVVEPASIGLPLNKPETTKLVDVACGRAHSFIVTDSEGVFSMGHNSYGQCGRPSVDNEVYRGSQTINKIQVDGKVVQVACGQDHTLLLTDEGRLFGCGLASDGQTGLGHYDCVGTPLPLIGDIVGEKITFISSRVDSALAVSDKGEVFGWGNCEYSQFGEGAGDKGMMSTPTHLPFPHVGRVVKTASAGSMCALLNDAGEVYVWGHGMLGKGPKLESTNTPELIPPVLFGQTENSPDVKVVDIQCGINHFIAMNSVGDVYSWGRNTRACLGLGHKQDQFFPMKVNIAGEVGQVACGVDHTFVLTKSFA